MKNLIVIFALSLAFSASTTLARKARGVELVAKDGSLRARIFLRSDSLLIDFPVQERGFLFKPGAYIYLNRTDKTYQVHSYANIVADVPNKAYSDVVGSQNPASDASVAGFRLTGETDLIAGFKTTKFARTSKGKDEVEMWVSEEGIPTALRAVGREIRAVLPTNYWNDDNRAPTLVQAILVFGLPLRMVDHESESSEVRAVRIKIDDIPDDLFEIPSEYRQREQVPQ